MQYYIAGRYAVISCLSPTAANQLHHAVEFLLKSYLAKKDSWATVLRYGHSPNKKYRKRGGYYGHDIRRLWLVYRKRVKDPSLVVHDEVIKRLHKFEDIRYPTDLVVKGGMLTITRYETDPPPRHRKSRVSKNRYFFLSLPQIDRLCKVLLDSCGYNRHLLSWLTQRPKADEYYRIDNEALILAPATSVGGAVSQP
jgi:hypothetical protein